MADGWYDRFGLPFAPEEHGYGHSAEQVAAVQVETALLDGYHAAVHDRTIAYVATVDDDELARVVDEAWDPPVTASVRLVSVVGDCMQHLGQAAYVRGMLDDLIRGVGWRYGRQPRNAPRRSSRTCGSSASGRSVPIAAIVSRNCCR